MVVIIFKNQPIYAKSDIGGFFGLLIIDMILHFRKVRIQDGGSKIAKRFSQAACPCKNSCKKVFFRSLIMIMRLHYENYCVRNTDIQNGESKMADKMFKNCKIYIKFHIRC